MPSGLQVWNAAGQLVHDTSDPTGVILGTHTFYGMTAGGSGNISVPDLALGNPFAVLRGSWFTDPVISISGTTITWTFPATVPGAVAYSLIYGYF